MSCKVQVESHSQWEFNDFLGVTRVSLCVYFEYYVWAQKVGVIAKYKIPL